ncbi:SMC-Scp complex subunit ScpB [Beduinella massiliensis]|uniref:SMC-Scp complex subunit ScpB n=1 Tax=Beduinella massiliensis TaxID=1852363 RepID=UPI0031F7BA3B
MEQVELSKVIEAILFVSGEPVEQAELEKALEVTSMELTAALDELENDFEREKRGIRLLRFGDHVQLGTRPDYAPYVERLLQPIQKQTLSQAVMETLAVIAYKQPVTRGEIEAIRGVKCDYSVQSLVNKRLICEVGRKETLGRPILYGTTDEFLRHFCISSLDELPRVDFSAVEAAVNAGAAEE